MEKLQTLKGAYRVVWKILQNYEPERLIGPQVLVRLKIMYLRNNYVGETMTSAIKRIDEYGQPTGKLEPSKHLKN